MFFLGRKGLLASGWFAFGVRGQSVSVKLPWPQGEGQEQ